MLTCVDIVGSYTLGCLTTASWKHSAPVLRWRNSRDQMLAISKSMSTFTSNSLRWEKLGETPTKAVMKQSSNPWSYWRNTLLCMTWYLYTKLNQTIRHVKSAAGLDIGGWYCHWLLAAQEGFFLPGSGGVSCRPRKQCTLPCLPRGGTRPRVRPSAAGRGNAFHGPGGSCRPDTRETSSKHG